MAIIQEEYARLEFTVANGEDSSLPPDQHETSDLIYGRHVWVRWNPDNVPTNKFLVHDTAVGSIYTLPWPVRKVGLAYTVHEDEFFVFERTDLTPIGLPIPEQPLQAEKVTKGTDGTVLFWCPGCEEPHGINTDSSQAKPCWEWNDSLTLPTFTPSILVRSVRPIENGKPVHPFRYKGSYPPPEGVVDPFICHSYVKDGRIEFLADCSHALAGQTVDLPDWEIESR